MSGGGKGGEKPKIPYYYMTVHFAVCHGPVDRVNKIWVKEKEIWCGSIGEDDLVAVHLPELFGGDKAEGGVSGINEVYMGGWEQMMSHQVAKRVGRTMETMPGYRGICNILFRGYTADEADERPSNGSFAFISGGGGQSPKSGGDSAFSSFGLLASTVSKLFSGLIGGNTADSKGWHWQTNNPYMPGAWVHVTRINKDLSTEWAEINAPAGGDMVTTYGGGSAGGMTGWIDLTPWRNAIKTGQATCDLSLSWRVLSNSIAPEDRLASGLLQVDFYAEQGGPVLGHAETSGAHIGEYHTISESDILIPANARWMFIQRNVWPGSAFEAAIILDYNVSTSSTGAGGGSTGNTSDGGAGLNSASGWAITAPAAGGGGFCNTQGDPGQRPDMNPAHIIYECLTNTDWGMGDPATAIDMPSFEYAAETLFEESFGLSMLWTGQTKIETFINEVLDHINATLFLHPRTGLWTLKLIRADYDVNTLPILNPTNCVATDRQRKALGETINEIIVEWSDPDTEEERTVTYHDLGNIAAQGAIVSDTRSYYGVRNPELANRLGQRDIRAAAYPIFSAAIEADRSFRYLTPGSVVKFSWPEDGIVNMVLRVTKIDPGKRNDSKVKIEAMEDVFAFELTQYEIIQETGWTPPVVKPGEAVAIVSQPTGAVDPVTGAPIYADVEIETQAILNPPLPLLVRTGAVDLDNSDDDYPSVSTLILGAAERATEIALYGDVVNPTGSVSEEKITSVYPTGGAPLTAPLVGEARSTLSAATVRAMSDYLDPVAGDFLILGMTDEDSEIVMLRQYITEGRYWIVDRGMFDTRPRFWDVGTWGWYIGQTLSTLYSKATAAETTLTLKMVPTNMAGSVDPADVDPISQLLSDRPYAPHRPANVKAVPTGGGAAVASAYPYALTNPGAESGSSPTGWTVSQMTTATSIAITSGGVTKTILPRTGTRFFAPVASQAAAWMQQRLSIPRRMRLFGATLAQVMSIRWYQAAYSNGDPVKVEVDFLRENLSVISTWESELVPAGIEPWAFRSVQPVIPAGAWHVDIRFEFALTEGASISSYIDDISVAWGEDDNRLLFMGVEIPTGFDLTWANRNRLMEDQVPPLWTDGNLTPEAGQTTTIRVEKVEDDSVLFEVTGLVGTSYSLAMPGGIETDKDYRIAFYGVRAGFESVQPSVILFRATMLGYDTFYDYDYGENDM